MPINTELTTTETAARDALLTAITNSAEQLQRDTGAQIDRPARLRNLAEAYALVVHGKE